MPPPTDYKSKTIWSQIQKINYKHFLSEASNSFIWDLNQKKTRNFLKSQKISSSFQNKHFETPKFRNLFKPELILPNIIFLVYVGKGWEGWGGDAKGFSDILFFYDFWSFFDWVLVILGGFSVNNFLTIHSNLIWTQFGRAFIQSR